MAGRRPENSQRNPESEVAKTAHVDEFKNGLAQVQGLHCPLEFHFTYRAPAAIPSLEVRENPWHLC